MSAGTACRPGDCIIEESMIARCQKRRRTRIAKGGQVFNEQAIWAKPELPARFCFTAPRPARSPHCEERNDEAIKSPLRKLSFCGLEREVRLVGQ